MKETKHTVKNKACISHKPNKQTTKTKVRCTKTNQINKHEKKGKRAAAATLKTKAHTQRKLATKKPLQPSSTKQTNPIIARTKQLTKMQEGGSQNQKRLLPNPQNSGPPNKRRKIDKEKEAKTSSDNDQKMIDLTSNPNTNNKSNQNTTRIKLKNETIELKQNPKRLVITAIAINPKIYKMLNNKYPPNTTKNPLFTKNEMANSVLQTMLYADGRMPKYLKKIDEKIQEITQEIDYKTIIKKKSFIECMSLSQNQMKKAEMNEMEDMDEIINAIETIIELHNNTDIDVSKLIKNIIESEIEAIIMPKEEQPEYWVIVKQWEKVSKSVFELTTANHTKANSQLIQNKATRDEAPMTHKKKIYSYKVTIAKPAKPNQQKINEKTAKILLAQIFKKNKTLLQRENDHWYTSDNLNKAESIKYNHGWYLTIKAAEGKCPCDLGEKFRQWIEKRKNMAFIVLPTFIKEILYEEGTNKEGDKTNFIFVFCTERLTAPDFRHFINSTELILGQINPSQLSKLQLQYEMRAHKKQNDKLTKKVQQMEMNIQTMQKTINNTKTRNNIAVKKKKIIDDKNKLLSKYAETESKNKKLSKEAERLRKKEEEIEQQKETIKKLRMKLKEKEEIIDMNNEAANVQRKSRDETISNLRKQVNALKLNKAAKTGQPPKEMNTEREESEDGVIAMNNTTPSSTDDDEEEPEEEDEDLTTNHQNQNNPPNTKQNKNSQHQRTQSHSNYSIQGGTPNPIHQELNGVDIYNVDDYTTRIPIEETICYAIKAKYGELASPIPLPTKVDQIKQMKDEDQAEGSKQIMDQIMIKGARINNYAAALWTNTLQMPAYAKLMQHRGYNFGDCGQIHEKNLGGALLAYNMIANSNNDNVKGYSGGLPIGHYKESKLGREIMRMSQALCGLELKRGIIYNFTTIDTINASKFRITTSELFGKGDAENLYVISKGRFDIVNATEHFGGIGSKSDVRTAIIPKAITTDTVIIPTESWTKRKSNKSSWQIAIFEIEASTKNEEKIKQLRELAEMNSKNKEEKAKRAENDKQITSDF